jgi:hypothetical protein
MLLLGFAGFGFMLSRCTVIGGHDPDFFLIFAVCATRICMRPLRHDCDMAAQLILQRVLCVARIDNPWVALNALSACVECH